MAEQTIQYEVDSEGRKQAVIFRETERSSTYPCPFCGKKHFHGIGDGERVAHCVPPRDRKGARKNKKYKSEVTAPDGTVLRKSDGYIVRTINPPSSTVVRDRAVVGICVSCLMAMRGLVFTTQSGSWSI
jgi:hypothetical protein